MRIAALILVLMLVVAIATEVDGFLGGRRRRRRRRRRPLPPPLPPPAPCDSCSCCKSSGKRSVDLDGNIYPGNDASLLEDYYSHYKGLPLWTRDAILKASEKRDLTYPGDCSSETLVAFAENCGFCVTTGGSDYKVCNGGEEVTVIPSSVDNATCKNIIDTLNARPECQDA